MAKYLSIVERAYHGTLEEQDDTALWITHMARKAGVSISLLLRANAVNYAVAGQDASGLSFGTANLDVPPTIDRDVEALMSDGVTIYAIAEDLADRGIDGAELVGGVEMVRRNGLARLLDEHDQIWHW